MAFLATDARAVSKGLYGRGGHGTTGTSWHNMPDATVRLLSTSDCRGDLEIRWYIDTLEGVLADLTIDEARTLRDRLIAAIAEFEYLTGGVTDNEVDDAVTVNADGTVLTLEPEPSFCEVCNGRIMLVHNGTDYWWSHEPYSVNDHEPVAIERCAVCGARIFRVDTTHYRWWTHEDPPDSEHEAVPRWLPAHEVNPEVA